MSVINRFLDKVLFWGGFAGGAYVTYRNLPTILKKSIATLSSNQQAQQLLANSGLAARLANRFPASATVEDAIAQAHAFNQRQVGVTLTLLGESAQYAHEAIEAKQAYLALITQLSAESLTPHLSIKPSHIGLSQSMQFAQENLTTILSAARSANLFVFLETEHSEQVQADIALHNALREAGHSNLGITLQVVLRRTSHDVESLLYQGAHVCLVQGDYRVGSGMQIVDENEARVRYGQYVQRMLSETAMRHEAKLTLASATNVVLQAAFDTLRSAEMPKDSIEIELHHGERPDLLSHLVSEGYSVHVYHPIGSDAQAYLLQNLLTDPTLLLS